MSIRRFWGVRLAVPVLSGVMMIGCGGGDGRNDERRAQQPQTNQPEAPAQATVSLSGCVEEGPGDRFVLRNVHFEPRAQGDPHRDTTTAGAQGITEGAWVRLTASDREGDLRAHLGQRVKLTGTVTDNGQNTIGTAGASGAPTAAGDTSHAASTKDHDDKVKGEAGRIARESMANGTAAEINVQKVEGTGERCAPRKPNY